MALSDEDKQWIESAIGQSFHRLEELFTSVTQSLEREMHAGFENVNTRFDDQAARLDQADKRPGEEGN